MRLFENQTMWVLKFNQSSDQAGRIVALTTEGRPFAAKRLKQVKSWRSSEEALDYAAMFPKELEYKAYKLAAEVSE